MSSSSSSVSDANLRSNNNPKKKKKQKKQASILQFFNLQKSTSTTTTTIPTTTTTTTDHAWGTNNPALPMTEEEQEVREVLESVVSPLASPTKEDQQPPQQEQQEEKEQEEAPLSYAEKRLRNIAENNRVLAELGLLNFNLFENDKKKKKKATKKRKKRHDDDGNEDLPRRRSSRLSKPVTPWNATTTISLEDAAHTTRQHVASFPELGSPVEFFNSFKFSSRREADREELDELGLSFTSWEGHGHKIYSCTMNPSHSILAVGGGKGAITFFPASRSRQQQQRQHNDEDDEEEQSVVIPLGTAKAHNRWISDIQYVSDVCLLSASDDRTLMASSIADDEDDGGVLFTPQHRLTNLHNGGIFSMHHSIDGNVITGSKDATIALSQLSDEKGLTSIRMFEDVFDNVVKCCRWSNMQPGIFAAGGNDGYVAIVDIRVATPEAKVTSYMDIHSKAVSSIRWHPSNEFLLFSSSFDESIQVYDLRKPSHDANVYSFQGHHAQKRPGKTLSLCSPEWIGNDSILTVGENSDTLFMYSLAQDSQHCAKTIGMDPTSLFVVPCGVDGHNMENQLLRSGDVLMSRGPHRLVSTHKTELFDF